MPCVSSTVLTSQLSGNLFPNQMVNLYPKDHGLAEGYNNFYFNSGAPCQGLGGPHVTSAAFFGSSAVCPPPSYIRAVQGSAAMTANGAALYHMGALATAPVVVPVNAGSASNAIGARAPAGSCAARSNMPGFASFQRAPCIGRNSIHDSAVTAGKAPYQQYSFNCQ